MGDLMQGGCLGHMKFNWDGFDCWAIGFNKLSDDGRAHGRDYKWVMWCGPFSIRGIRA